MKIQALITLLSHAQRAVACPDASSSSEQQALLRDLQDAHEHLSTYRAIEPEFITVYESASSDGYRPSGDGALFLESSHADSHASDKHGGYAANAIQHQVIADGTGRFIAIKSTHPMSLFGSKQAREDLRAQALAKLTDAEREALEA